MTLVLIRNMSRYSESSRYTQFDFNKISIWPKRLRSKLGFIANCIIDTHFIKRGRIGRLAHAVVLNSGNLGLGLGEDTALLIHGGNRAACLGFGMLIIFN